MKKFTLITLFSLFGFLTVSAQLLKPFPIPSFHVAVDSSCAQFIENPSPGDFGASLEKRDVHVIVINHGPETINCHATVWVYSLDGLDIYGPYTVPCGESLVVPVDDREWGVIVQSDYDIVVDVWIE